MPRILLLLLFLPLGAQPRWAATWASSQQKGDPGNVPPEPGFNDATVRQTFHISLGGRRLRVRFSNEFGNAPLKIQAAHLALSTGGSAIQPDTDRALTFLGNPDITIPPGAPAWSDPRDFNLPPLADVAVSLYLRGAPSDYTTHPGARTPSFFKAGNLVSAPDLPEATSKEHWYFVSGIDVVSDSPVLVVVGDSITDGRNAKNNGRWPDALSRRLQGKIGVVNAGIGGNCLLFGGLGPNALARFDRDVLAQSGVRWLILLEGVNDIGGRAQTTIDELRLAYTQIVERAHARRIRVFGGTIMPFGGSFYDKPAAESTRQAINQWIRTSGVFDAVIDFDAATRDPQTPGRLRPEADSGDHLHPANPGYQIMADEVDLKLFAPLREVALTFDDLPSHGPLPAGVTRLDVARSVLGALRAAGAPPTLGLVNGKLVQDQPADEEVLNLWTAAGHPLGNHTWSHPNLNALTVEAFEKEIAANEPLLRAHMPTGDWHWFRFPFLSEGNTPEKKRGVADYLARNGYKVAPVSLSFGDYGFNEPYSRCVARNDAAGLEEVKSLYMQGARDSLRRGIDGASDVRHVMLLHIGSFQTVMLPRLLDLIKEMGYTLAPPIESPHGPPALIAPPARLEALCR